MDKYRYFLKNTLLLTISNFSSKILIFLLVPIYTSALTTIEYGNYDLITTTISLFIPIITLNICEAIMRFTMDESVKKVDIITIGFRIISISVLVSGIIIFINERLNLWNGLSDYSLEVFAFFVANLLYQFIIQFAKGLEDVKGVAIAGILSTIFTVAGNIVLLLVLDLHLKGFYIAYILGQFIPFLFLAFRLKITKYISFNINKELKQKMIGYSIPLIFNSLGWWVNSVSDRYIVTWICGFAINGIYSISYKIPSILNTFQNIFNQAWQISAIKEYDKDEAETFYNNMLYFVNSLMVLAGVVLILFSKVIAHFLYAKDFYVAWVFVPFLIISNVINSASGVIGPVLSAANKTRALGKSAIYGAVVNVVLNVMLVHPLGAQGAAIATFISSFVIFYFRKTEAQVLVHIDKINRIYASWIGLIVQAVLMIYCSNIISYVLQIFVLVFEVVLFRSEVFMFVKKIMKIKRK